jgi:hypothetical protein
VFFDSQARISLLGEVGRATPVDKLRRCGAAIAGFGTCCSEAGSNCVAIPPNRELTKSFERLGTLIHIISHALDIDSFDACQKLEILPRRALVLPIGKKLARNALVQLSQVSTALLLA